MGSRRSEVSSPATPSGALSPGPSAARPRPRRMSPRRSLGSPARRSRARVASASAACSFSAPRVRARRCSRRRSRPASTRRSCRSRARVSRDVHRHRRDLVRYVSCKAKRLARKWGGQCIVFIDEIDAVGMRRQALGLGGAAGFGITPANLHDYFFFGPYGSLTPSGDLILESRAWREPIFAERARSRGALRGSRGMIGSPSTTFPGCAAAAAARAQPAARRHGRNRQPALLRRVPTTHQHAPRRLLRRAAQVGGSLVCRRRRRAGSRSTSSAPPTCRSTGSTPHSRARADGPPRLVPHADEARPHPRFDLYLGGLARARAGHGARRDELARVTLGYSPAMIDQVCSMALTIAHH